ncbi:ABC transporter permease [Propionibacterium freudenreichii]|uniref:ABC transporter permease n=1 Tax=Propionibacterium freudenreichii TaxID=1744 RepID=UPI0005A5C899|nr:ABC transporter permease [Propionibacterium freudenreichii]CEI50300.1 Hypothetical membrane protein [Propionibacterium freudenreichii]
MLMTFARRELGRRRRQTIIVALGLAIAVALLMVVHSVSSGVSRAQSEVLSSVYGVGTDITVTQKSTQQPGQGFDMAPGAQDANGNTSVANKDVSVVGIVTSSSSSSISEVYLPLKTAQALSDNTDKISEILVQASDSNQVSTVASALTKALPSATVSTQEALAQSVSGSLGSASKLISSLGTWLSIGVVVVAFGLAVLFTVSGVNQRTRDFGTLKALGWSRRRIVGQVATESLLRAGIGGAAGIVLGLVATLVINAMGITLSGSTGGFSMGGGRGAPGGQPSGMPSMAGGQAGGAPAGGGGGMAERASNAVNVVLHSPVSIQMIAIGLAAALVGGLLAGVIGGWRAGGMRPAEALRSVE